MLAVRESAELVVLTVRGRTVTSDAAHGDSIAVNGVCLTVTRSTRGAAAEGRGADGPTVGDSTVELVPETLERTSLAASRRERGSTSSAPWRPAAASAATSCRATSTGSAPWSPRPRRAQRRAVASACPADLARYVVEKGSIAVDGVSLTVAGTDGTTFTVALIPTTLATPRSACAGRRSRQPRGRRDREVRGEVGVRRVGGDDDHDGSTPSSARSPTSPPGRPVVVVDDEDRENEGDLIFAAELATPGAGGVHGPLHLGLHLRAADRGRLRPARPAADVPHQPGPRGTAYTVTVDAREGVTTGISAADRAHTDPAARRPDATAGRPRPARPRRSRCAPRRAACCAGPGTPRPPSTWPGWPGCARPACCARSSAEGRRRHGPAADELRVFADEHDLALISIADLIAYRRRTEKQVERVAEARMPTAARRVHAPSATAARSTAPSTSRWSTATSATARTCWSGCTPSA